jgi:hypothetical protein
MPHQLFRGLFLVSLNLLAPAALWAQSPSFSIKLLSTFDYPQATIISGSINRQGAIAGAVLTQTAREGFVRSAGGKLGTPFADPDAVSGVYTQATGINQSGVVCGYYFGDDADLHGFFRSGPTFTTYDAPGGVNTEILAINDAGDFAGQYASNTYVAFVNIDGAVTMINVPGEKTTDLVSGINNADDVVGWYEDANGVTHGYERAADGTFTFPIDFPGGVGTRPTSINDKGWIVGSWDDQSNVTHGFFLRLPNHFVSFDAAGGGNTVLTGINNAGTIAGYSGTGNQTEGFVAQVQKR